MELIKLKGPEFMEKVEGLGATLEKHPKVWTDFKVKVLIADVSLEVLQSAPKKVCAKEKLACLKMLNQAIMVRNKDFNVYVAEKVLPYLTKLANVKPKDKQSAVELLERGQHLFGKDELDLETSAEFLIILLDFIEKWSTVSSEFSTYYKQLVGAGIQFPSSLKHLEKTPAQAKK